MSRCSALAKLGGSRVGIIVGDKLLDHSPAFPSLDLTFSGIGCFFCRVLLCIGHCPITVFAREAIMLRIVFAQPLHHRLCRVTDVVPITGRGGQDVEPRAHKKTWRMPGSFDVVGAEGFEPPPLPTLCRDALLLLS